MQPYFFPYLGYFDLINFVDVWVVYNASQYVRHGWMNRNRVLHPSSGWRYIVVPVEKHGLAAPLSRIRTANRTDWKADLFKRLEPYRKEAPFYPQVRERLEEWLAPTENNLAHLNTRLLLETCRYLGIRTPFHPYSPEAFPEIEAATPEALALGLCRAFGADEYVNRPGGAAQFREGAFREAGIRLTIQSFRPMAYNCGRYAHVPDLSVIDAMMWNPPETIKRYLETWRSTNAGEGTPEVMK
jgi:hypothetical protein